jgi:hypothetical protein
MANLGNWQRIRMLFMERVTGPYKGVYIAAYTTGLDGLFYGYAKLCTECPDDVWSAKTTMKIGTWKGRIDEAAALHAIEAKALRIISELQVPIEGLWSRLFSRRSS